MLLKENKFKKLYKQVAKEYKFLINSTDICSLTPASDKKLRYNQLKLTDFCYEILNNLNKNGINYFLGYGNLIGAIRHKGFIPWDDDFDVEMLRDEYNKLIEYCKNNFIKINIKDSLGNLRLRYNTINKYLKRYPNEILYFRNPYYLKLIKGTSVDDMLVLDCFVLDFYNKNYDIKEHLSKLSRYKNKINELKTDDERLNYIDNEIKSNKSIINNNINLENCYIYHGLDSLSSYDKWRASSFFEIEDYLPAKKIIFEGKEFFAPNNPQKIVNLTYNDIYKFPSNIDLLFHENFRTKHSNKNLLLSYLKNKIFNTQKKRLILNYIKYLLRNKNKYYQEKYEQKKKELDFLKNIIP